jgi:hypothetical protein
MVLPISKTRNHVPFVRLCRSGPNALFPTTSTVNPCVYTCTIRWIIGNDPAGDVVYKGLTALKSRWLCNTSRWKGVHWSEK